ncbi:MAG: 16S rRNA (cytosine(967)-C(5))-methyltransferase RsmB [Candidatus Accumulibacter sp.]|jgi:16S rRNA (cytosine967-C5)-methyltransferase|nr:16S rRNA (cytosine(967)-C(5))-methyltransferase RsmB [Accumulibacter sp.]
MAANIPPCGLDASSLGYSLLLAARVLVLVHAGKSLNEAFSLLAGEPDAARAAARDAIYGTLRSHGRGEFILGRLMKQPLTHAETQALLLAALYRLETRLEAAPMVVDQAVAAAGELTNGALKGVVNGVLRNFLRQRERLLTELRQDDVAYFQHPAWWLSRLRRAYPEDWQGIVAADNGPPPMTLRVNARRISVDDYLGKLQAAGIVAKPAGAVGLMLETPQPVNRLPGFTEGWVSVQDAGAQRAAELLDPAAGERILDACAAPGGKAAHLLERAEADLLALDIDAARMLRVENNLKRLGLTAGMRVADCLAVERWWDGRRFDAILADVPCSASGVARRHPDIKALRRESDIRRLAHAQAAILDALWPTLKSGGRLLYATCSVFVEENAAQTDAFLARWTDARRIAQERCLPNRENDGFYYALLRKT